MSQENVELQHRLTDAFNRRDLDAFLRLTDEDVEANPRTGAMEGGYHGHDWNPSHVDGPARRLPRLQHRVL